MTFCEICNRNVKRRTSCKVNNKKMLLCKKCAVISKNHKGKLSFKDFFDQQLNKQQQQKFLKSLLKK